MVKYDLYDESNTILKLKVRGMVLQRMRLMGFTSIVEAWNFWHEKIQIIPIPIGTKIVLKAEEIFVATMRDDRSFEIKWMKKPWAVVYMVPN